MKYLGIALVISISALGLGGIIAALYREPPSEAAITVIGTIIGALIGGLVGHAATKPTNQSPSDFDDYEDGDLNA